MNKLIYFFVFAGVLFTACRRDEKKNEVLTHPYTIQVPKGFPAAIYSADLPMTEEGVKLGRMLFYDNILSSNGRSCNSCHHQDKSFMIKNSDLGLDPAIYPNIPPLINLAWNPDYGWNGGEGKLDHVAVGDFGPAFFNSNVPEVIQQVKNNAVYKDLYDRIFNHADVFHEGIFQEKTAAVIAQFLRSIVTYQSKFDRYKMGKATMTQDELYGRDIFFSEKGDCFHCHGTPLFTDNEYHNIGLDVTYSGFNQGRYLVTGNPQHMGQFSSPTLRNIALTAPYMHDGRFQTLEEVIEHYNSGVKNGENLDPLMTKANLSTKLNLSAQEKQYLLAFLKTLTDSTVLTNPDYDRPH